MNEEMENDSNLFKNSLKKRPLIITITPLRDSKTGDKVHDDRILMNLEQKKSEIVKALGNHSRLNAVNVPELIEENHEGKPRYNSIYTRALARGTADLLHIDAIVNKVVVHLDSYEKFIQWIDETYEKGIGNMIFVGGNSRHYSYPGPTVSEANIIAKRYLKMTKNADITIGNISLPERRGEAKRMLFKTISGAQFFTTQILFESSTIINLLDEYSRLCNVAKIDPATIILSFVPLRNVGDLNLLDFLGVDLPEHKRIEILEGKTTAEAARMSIHNALKVYHDIIEHIENTNLNVPIGINVEQLTKSNFSWSIQMLNEFQEIIDEPSSTIMLSANKFLT